MNGVIWDSPLLTPLFDNKFLRKFGLFARNRQKHHKRSSITHFQSHLQLKKNSVDWLRLCVYMYIKKLTVHRNENGSTNEPDLATRSLRTKLELPMISLVTFPKEQPFRTPGCACTVLCWYSLRHSRNAVAHCGHPVVFVARTLNGTPQQ